MLLIVLTSNMAEKRTVVCYYDNDFANYQAACCFVDAWDIFAVCHEISILNFREVFSLASYIELRDLQNTLRQYFTGDCIAVPIYHSGTSIW